MASFLSLALFIAPWFLLIPLELKRVKRFLSVTFFNVILISINWKLAQIYNWWTIKTNLPFLTNTPSFGYGLLPVATMLVFYFTYPRPWLFFGTNLVIDAIQAFIISPFIFQRFGLYKMNTLSSFGLFLLEFGLVIPLYLYQKWYDKGQSK
jgi:hypothetical protein